MRREQILQGGIDREANEHHGNDDVLGADIGLRSQVRIDVLEERVAESDEARSGSRDVPNMQHGGQVMPKLWDIAADVLALDDLIDQLEGDVSDPQVEAAWLAMLAELQHDESAKLDGMVNWIRSLEMEANAARAEAELYMLRAKSRENRAAWIKGRIKDYLILTNRKSIKTETGRTVAVQANGGKQALELVDNLDPAELPSEFVVVRRVPDMDKIRRHVEEIGALPFATLKPRGSHLSIR